MSSIIKSALECWRDSMRLPWPWNFFAKKLQGLFCELFPDKNADTIIFLGPSQSGKSELLAALIGEEFNHNRYTTSKEKRVEILLGEKSLVVFDSAGQRNWYQGSLESILNSLKRSECGYVLLVLVVDLSKIESVEQVTGVNVIGEENSLCLGDYLHFISDNCNRLERGDSPEGLDKGCQRTIKESYTKGRWAYALVGTHAGDATSSQRKVFQQVLTAMHKWQGRMRALSSSQFELNPEVKSLFGGHNKEKTEQRRQQIVKDVRDWLKRMVDQLHME